MKRAPVGFVICFALILFPMTTHADNPTKEELAVQINRIEGTIREMKVFPVLPQDPVSGGITCLVGTYAICTRPDGTVTAYCSDPNLSCETNPSPDQCPEVCKAQGGVVVVDYAIDPCDALATGQPFPFVCMSAEDYANSRPSCPANLVPHYRSDTNAWVCEIPVGTVHISTSVFDALLLERSRTSYIQEHLEDQIDELNNEIKKICDCPGVFDPVSVGQTVYINECEANCASSWSSGGQ